MTPQSRFNICRDLGYKASDLLQANFIIWVEGPSDRIYLNHWISGLASEFMEGIHYSIMFYGGRLLSHLSASDSDGSEEDVKALIAVRKLNRHLAILLDSDKAKKSASINTTKSRILDELNTHGGIGWLTAGREIENYIPSRIMTEALQHAYPRRFKEQQKTGFYDHVLPFIDMDGKVCKDVDKVRVAREVCKQPPDFTVLDLKERMESLVQLIREANG